MAVEDKVLRLTAMPPRNEEGLSFFQIDGEAMGTTCRVLFSAASRSVAKAFCSGISTWLASFENRYSRFIDSSMISRINAAAGGDAVEIDEELTSILNLCDWFHWASRGLFDPTMLPLARLWDYHTDSPTVPTKEAVEAALTMVDWKSVERGEGTVRLPHKGMALDLGGIGKEYAVDRVIEMAGEAGIRNAMVDFGHDVRTIGSPPEGGPWRIGLEDPSHPGRCWSGVGLSGMAIASSGNYARGFDWEGKRYGHILDPRSGYPVDNGSLAVSVVAQTCTEAGILATTAFVLGEGEFGSLLGSSHQAEGCMVTSRGTVQSRDFRRYALQQQTAA